MLMLRCAAVGLGRREIAHLLGCLQDLLAHFLADAVFAGQPFADGYDADAQLLCNICHAHSLCHKIPLFCRLHLKMDGRPKASADSQERYHGSY